MSPTTGNRVTLEEPFRLANFVSPVATTNQPSKSKVTLSAIVENVDGCETTVVSSEGDDRTADLVLGISGGGVHLYNTGNQKRTKSFPAPPTFRLSCPARARLNLGSKSQPAPSSMVYAVLEGGSASDAGREVWFWEETDGASQKHSHKFDKAIHCLLVSASLPDRHILLVHVDGSISLVTESFSRTTAHVDYPFANAVVLWCVAYPGEGENTSIFMALRNDRGKLDIALFNVDTERKSVEFVAKAELAVEANCSRSPIAYAIDAATQELSIITASGELMVYKITHAKQQSSYNQLEAEQILRRQLKDLASHATTSVPEVPKPSSKKKTKSSVSIPNDPSQPGQAAALAALGSSYLAILTPCDLAHALFNLTLWDVRHGTVQAVKVLSFHENGAQRLKQANLPFEVQLCAVNSRLVAALTHLGHDSTLTAVVACDFYCPPVSLLGALGMMKLTSNHTEGEICGTTSIGGLAKAVPAHASSDNTTSLIGLWENNIQKSAAAEGAMMNKICSFAKSSSTQEFTDTFFEYVQPKNTKEQTERIDTVMKDATAVVETEGELDEKPLPADANPDLIIIDEDDDHAVKLEKLRQKRMRSLRRLQVKQSNERKKENLRRKQSKKAPLKDIALSSASINHLIGLIFPSLSEEGKDIVNLKKTAPKLSSFWPNKVISYMVTNGLIHSNNVDGGIVCRISDRADWNLLDQTLRHVKDIPETDLIHLLKIMLPVTSVDSNLTPAVRLRILRSIASAPRNDSSMLVALQSLNSVETVLWMEQLISWLDGWSGTVNINHDKKPEGERWSSRNTQDARVAEVQLIAESFAALRAGPDPELELPSLSSVVDHATLLLDAHFAGLLMSPESHGAVATLTERVQEQVGLCEGLEILRGGLVPYRSKVEKKKPTKAGRRGGHVEKPKGRRMDVTGASSGIGIYGVELLHL